MPVTSVNRRLTIRMFEVLGLWERVQRLGIVDASPYDPASKAVADRNIALPQGMRADLNNARPEERACVEGEHELFGFLTTEANAVVAPIHPKAMPVILTSPAEVDTWLEG